MRASAPTDPKLPIPFDALYQKVVELGWDDVSVTTPEIPDADIAAYRQWIEDGCAGDLAYMHNDLRTRPLDFLPGAKSAIMMLSYYRQEHVPFRKDAGVIASYARGRDYHNIHRRRSKKLIRWLEDQAGQTDIAAAFSDSAPVMERALAVKAGLGWMGKNGLVIHRKFGTFTLLSGILTTIDIEMPTKPDHAFDIRLPRCGSCTLCLDACPTDAITASYRVDARRCLSNHLIESKDPIPDDIARANPGYILGCDICQDVCPHNARRPLSAHTEFSPESGHGPYIDAERLSLLEEQPELLHGSPLQRRKVAGLRHTAETLGLIK